MSAAINNFVGDYTSAGKSAANSKSSISLDAGRVVITNPPYNETIEVAKFLTKDTVNYLKLTGTVKYNGKAVEAITWSNGTVWTAVKKSAAPATEAAPTPEAAQPPSAETAKGPRTRAPAGEAASAPAPVRSRQHAPADLV